MARHGTAHEMLSKLGLANVNLTNKTGRGTTTTIALSPVYVSRRKEYHECVYKAPNGLLVTVFVAEAVCDNNLPPDSFNTSGYRGMLHIGIVKLRMRENGIFLVIHPRDWKPYQHNFKPSHIAFVTPPLAAGAGAGAVVGTIVGVGYDATVSFIAAIGTSTVAGATFGSTIPLAGTIIGAAVGAVFGLLVAAASMGDYLHFLG